MVDSEAKFKKLHPDATFWERRAAAYTAAAGGFLDGVDRSFNEFALKCVQEEKPIGCQWGDAAFLNEAIPYSSGDIVDLNSTYADFLKSLEGHRAVVSFHCFVRQPLDSDYLVGGTKRGDVWVTSKYRDEMVPGYDVLDNEKEFKEANEGGSTFGRGGVDGPIWSRQVYRCAVMRQDVHTCMDETVLHDKHHVTVIEILLVTYGTEDAPGLRLNDVVQVTGFCRFPGISGAKKWIVPFDDLNKCRCTASSIPQGDCIEEKGTPYVFGDDRFSSTLSPFVVHAFRIQKMLPCCRKQPIVCPFTATFKGLNCKQWSEKLTQPKVDKTDHAYEDTNILSARSICLNRIAEQMGGDALAAEYLILSLCSSSNDVPADDPAAVHRMRMAFVFTEKDHKDDLEKQSYLIQENPEKICTCSYACANSRKIIDICQEYVSGITLVLATPETLANNLFKPELRLNNEFHSPELLSVSPFQQPSGAVLVFEMPSVINRKTVDSASEEFVKRLPSEEKKNLLRKNCLRAREVKECSGSSVSEKDVSKSSLKQIVAERVDTNLSFIETLASDGEVLYDFIGMQRSHRTDVCCIFVLSCDLKDANRMFGLIGDNDGQSDDDRRIDITSQAISIPIDGEIFSNAHNNLSVSLENVEEYRKMIKLFRGRNYRIQLMDGVKTAATETFVESRKSDDNIRSSDFRKWLQLAAAVAASFGSFYGCCERAGEYKSQPETQGVSYLKHCCRECTTCSQGHSSENIFQSCCGCIQTVCVSVSHWEYAMKLESRRRQRVKELVESAAKKNTQILKSIIAPSY